MKKILLLTIFALLALSSSFCKFFGPESISFHGRNVRSPEKILFDWSGVSFSILFSNSSVAPAVMLVDNGNWYKVFLKTSKNEDIVAEMTIACEKDPKTINSYPLFNDLKLDPNSEYLIEIFRKTESFFGVSSLIGFNFPSSSESAGVVVKKIPEKKIPKIDFYGDSLSCGYGVEGKAPCGFSASTESSLISFPYLTAKELNMDPALQCWSGKGIVRNYGDKNTTSVDPFPVYYDRVIANDPNTKNWNFSNFVPEILVLTFGGNDFSTAPRPSYEEFSKGYFNFLERLQRNYRDAYNKMKVFLVCGPLYWDCYGDFVKKVVDDRRSIFREKNIYYVGQFGLFEADKECDKQQCVGCDGHPSALGAKKMMQSLVKEIRKVYP